MTTYKLSDLVSPAFYELHREIKAGNVTEIVGKGGRGSTKSSWVSIEVPLLLIRNPDIHAVVFRKVGNTLRNSVYAQYCWAIAALGLQNKFKCTVSPMEITYKATGQKIIFMGLDDPAKAKSIKVPFGYIGIAHFEELDQFTDDAEIRNVEQSIFRGGQMALCFKTFNPPAAARNWANRYGLESKKGKIVHHSTYLTTPEAWLGPKFIADAEHLKATNPTAYRHEYLGEVVGSGTAVFENIKDERLSQEMIDSFDRPLNGLDWGYYPDPFAFNTVHFDSARRRLYIFRELTAQRKGNRETADMLIDLGVGFDELITADSAEPKSIGDYKNYGLRCRGAEKGPGSVDYSFKWLQSLDAIIIDSSRCPDTYKEFSEYEYERNKDGDILSGYPDTDNHHIDACRYATERIWKRRGR